MDLIPDYDRSGYALLFDQNFLDKIISGVSNKTMDSNFLQEIKPYLDAIVIDELDYIAPGLSLMYHWVSSIYQLTSFEIQLSTYQKDLTSYQSSLKKLEIDTASILANMNEIERTLISQGKDLALTIQKRDKLENEKSKLELRKNAAVDTISATNSYFDNWLTKINTIEKHKLCIIHNCLYSSFYQVCDGLIPSSFKQNAYSDLKSCLKKYQMENIDENGFLEQIVDQKISGEIFNLFSSEFARVVSLIQIAQRVPLIIDPSQILLFYFSNQENAVWISLKDPKFEEILLESIVNGRTILIFNCDFFHPILNPIFNLIMTKTITTPIRIGSQTINFNPSFSLYLFTRNPQVSVIDPRLLVRVTVIDAQKANYQAIKAQIKTDFLEKFFSGNVTKALEVRKNQYIFKYSSEQKESDLLDILNEMNHQNDFLKFVPDIREISQKILVPPDDSIFNTIVTILEPYKKEIDLLYLLWEKGSSLRSDISFRNYIAEILSLIPADLIQLQENSGNQTLPQLRESIFENGTNYFFRSSDDIPVLWRSYFSDILPS